MARMFHCPVCHQRALKPKNRIDYKAEHMIFFYASYGPLVVHPNLGSVAKWWKDLFLPACNQTGNLARAWRPDFPQTICILPWSAAVLFLISETHRNWRPHHHAAIDSPISNTGNWRFRPFGHIRPPGVACWYFEAAQCSSWPCSQHHVSCSALIDKQIQSSLRSLFVLVVWELLSLESNSTAVFQLVCGGLVLHGSLKVSQRFKCGNLKISQTGI